MIEKQKEEKGEKSEVYINKEGIIYFGTGKHPTEENIGEALDKVTEILKDLKGEGKVLIHASPYTSFLSGGRIRNKLADRVKEIFTEIGFKKVAIFGGDAMSRTITSFMITASGMKNMKVFEEREEALIWLKSDS